jgi:hypothetical protein
MVTMSDEFSRRLKQYSRPTDKSWWHGEHYDPANIERWQARATENSKIAPRARDGEIELPSTNVRTRDTSMRPLVKRSAEAIIKQARSDLDHVGEDDYIPRVRRTS